MCRNGVVATRKNFSLSSANGTADPVLVGWSCSCCKERFDLKLSV